MLSKTASSLLVLFLTSGTLCLQAANDWPQWRGPNHDGLSTETGLLKAWPAGGPPLAWKAKGLGSGYSTVSLAGSRIYTQGDKGDVNHVIALNRADGKLLWEAKLGKAGAPGWGGFAGPRGTPTVDGDLVYAVAQYGELICLEAATGLEKWRKDYTNDFGGRLPEWGFSGSPLVDSDQVLFTPGGKNGNVVALNKRSGELLWQSKELTDSLHYASLVPVETGGTRQYLLLTDASVASLAVKDGKLLWRAPRKGATAVIPDPIYHDHHVYVTSGYGIGCNLFKITANGGTFSAEQVYANKVMVNHIGQVLKIGDHVYGYSDGKGWTCQNLKTGEAVWQEKSKLGKGSIAYADGHFVLRADEGKGTVVLIEATPSSFKEKGRFDQPDRSGKNSWPPPVIADGKLYLRDQDTLLCYDIKAK